MANFNRVWAESADIADINEPDVGAIEAGHGTVTPPKHDWENWWKNQVAKAMQDIQRYGAITWSSDVPYKKGTNVLYGGALYLSLVDNNTGSRPDISPSQWRALSAVADASERLTLTLNGDFNAGQEIVLVKQGGVVTVTAKSVLTHQEKSYVITDINLIPSGFRPTTNISNVYECNTFNTGGAADRLMAGVTQSGRFILRYFEGYTSATRTDSYAVPSVTYVIT